MARLQRGGDTLHIALGDWQTDLTKVLHSHSESSCWLYSIPTEGPTRDLLLIISRSNV